MNNVKETNAVLPSPVKESARTQRLRKLYDKAAKNNPNGYQYLFSEFKMDAYCFLREIREEKTVCSIKVSGSGMTRKFNYKDYNMLLNICYNEKFSWDAVKVEGCGMNMHWHLQFYACEELMTQHMIQKWSMNRHCGYGKVL